MVLSRPPHPMKFERSLLAILLLPLPFASLFAVEEQEPEILHEGIAVENVCAWPNLTRLEDGSLVVVFHNQPSHGQQEGDVECWASVDGVSWEKRSIITRHEPDTVRMNHAAGLAKDGSLLVLCSGWSNRKHPDRPKQKAFRDDILSPWILRSRDGGANWTQSEEFPRAESGWSEYIPFGDIWSGEDGRLHTSCYQGRYREPKQSTATAGWRSWHFYSEDDGETWIRGAQIGARHNETAIFPADTGAWLAAARIDCVELIRSEDDGKTWSDPMPVTGRNEINGHFTQLADGRLLLSYGVRIDGRRGVCAKLSEDGGKTWSPPFRISHTDDGGDCGYPSTVQREDGALVTAWYSNRSPLHRGYHLGVTVWKAPAR